MPPLGVTGVMGSFRLTAHWLHLRWRIEGAQQLAVPAIVSKARADGLWQTTCFEVFLKPQGMDAYHEWNLSPSRRWNAYAFEAYRAGVSALEVSRAPDCVWHGGSKFAIFDAAVARRSLPAGPCALSLSAVIEETGDTKSYWALAHPSGKPDFHHPACFVASLAAPRNP